MLGEGGRRVDGIQGVPPGGVRYVGTLPDSFPQWEEEQPTLNDWG